ncbi:MAG: hypothetical protein P1U84_12060 [Parvibaculaceae bacterium]|nr:hypothetical protein [Parvibaculaceae bacterium]
MSEVASNVLVDVGTPYSVMRTDAFQKGFAEARAGLPLKHDEGLDDAYDQDNYELGRQFAARNPTVELFNDRGAIEQPVRRLFALQWGEGGMLW